MSHWPGPVTLEGHQVILQPLSQDHRADLQEAAADGDLHELWYTTVPAPDNVGTEIARRIGLQKIGTMLPFAVIERASGQAVGMTTYMNIEPDHRHLEIGSTWYRTSVQRTAVNTECKLLLLTHAFEVLDCIAVEFRTHVVNEKSRRAIERIGAKLDGVLRAHMIMPNGSVRDSAVYSIIASEWPAVKSNLQGLLTKPE